MENLRKLMKRIKMRKVVSLVLLTLLFLPFQNCGDGFSTEGLSSSVGGTGDPSTQPLDPESPVEPEPPAEPMPPLEPVVTVIAPSNLRSSNITQTQVQLSWNDNSNNEMGFHLERSSSAGSNFTQIAVVNSNLTSFTVANLTAGTTYYFRLRAYRDAVNSNYSNTVTVSTTPVVAVQPPAAPTELEATATSTTQINLKWRDVSSNEQGFYIERRTGSGQFSQVGQVGANVTTYSNTGLTAATAYSFRVRAFNTDGSSSYTAVVDATTQNPPPPPTASMVNAFMAQGHIGRTIMSCDGGATWINDRSDNPNSRCWIDGPNYVECDHTSNTGRGLDAGDGYFFANFGWGRPGSVKRSVDGINWTTIRATGGNGDGVLYHDGRLFNNWGIYNSAHSDDYGQTWTPAQLPQQIEMPLGHRAGNLFFIANRDRAGLSISRDGGVTWQYRSEISNAWTKFFAYGNNRHIIVGGTNALVSTDNGLNWSRNANAITGSFVGLVFTGTQFVGFTSSARWTSSDGVTWTQRNITVNSNLALNKPIAYNPDTSTYVSIPEHWGATYGNQRALRSTDGGLTWTQLSPSAFPGGHPITRIVVGPMDARYCR